MTQVLDDHESWNANPRCLWVVYVYTLFPVPHESATVFPLLWVPAVLSVWINFFFLLHVCTEEGIYHVLWSSAVCLGGLIMCMFAGLSLGWQHGCLMILSLTLPTFSDLQFNPTFLPCPLQDIYELKDQIQDVEGRYMQGLKELKVEGLELAACLLVFSGSSLALLTLLFLLTLHPPLSCSPPPQALYCICVLLFAWSSNHVLVQLTGCGLKERHSHTSAGCRFVRKRFNMLHLLTDNMLLILRLCFQAEFFPSHQTASCSLLKGHSLYWLA